MSEVRYSIKDLENYTDIKAHTIRIWEQRYQLLTPKRTDTNRRYYGEEDFKKLLNINLLYLNGFKISKIALLSEEEIIKKAKTLIYENDTGHNGILNDMIVSILSFDKKKLIQLIDDQLKNDRLDVFFEKVVIPLLSKIGRLWQVNSFEIVHEHFFSMTLKEVIYDEIRKLDSPLSDDKKALLFLHDDEEHEFGLLIYHFILKRTGYNVINLGPKVPLNELSLIIEAFQPKVIATTFVAVIDEDRINHILDVLKKLKTPVLVSGAQINRFNIKSSDNISVLEKISDLEQKIS